MNPALKFERYAYNSFLADKDGYGNPPAIQKKKPGLYSLYKMQASFVPHIVEGRCLFFSDNSLKLLLLYDVFCLRRLLHFYEPPYLLAANNNNLYNLDKRISGCRHMPEHGKTIYFSKYVNNIRDNCSCMLLAKGRLAGR